MNYHEQADCQNKTFKKKHIFKLISKLISSKESLEYICHSFGDLLRSTQLIKNMDSKDSVPWLKQIFYAFESQKGLECCSAWSHKESDMAERLNKNESQDLMKRRGWDVLRE